MPGPDTIGALTMFDIKRIQSFAAERIPGITRVIVVDGQEGGPARDELAPVENDLHGELEWMGLRQLYDHFLCRGSMLTERWLEALTARPRAPADAVDKSAASPTSARRIDGGGSGETARSQSGAFDYLTLIEAANRIPGRRYGKRISVGTVWRWCKRGVRGGIRLRSVLVGGQRCTTEQWLKEFIEAMNQDAEPETVIHLKPRTPNQRQRASERAIEELKAAWEKRKRR